MYAAEGLGLAQQTAQVFESRLDQPSHSQVDVHQVDIIFDKVLETLNNFEVERTQLDICLAFRDLLCCQFLLLVLQEFVICEGQAHQARVLTDFLQ